MAAIVGCCCWKAVEDQCCKKNSQNEVGSSHQEDRMAGQSLQVAAIGNDCTALELSRQQKSDCLVGLEELSW